MNVSRVTAIIGAGPAGFTAAHELLSRAPGHRVVMLEESHVFGGISRTILHNGNRMNFEALGVSKMAALGMIDSASAALDTHVERVKKAYPAYFDTYAEFPKLRAWLDTIPNLFCVGRNGQHRYNNIDHSMCTTFETVHAILAGSSDRSAVWNVNTEREYHEEK